MLALAACEYNPQLLMEEGAERLDANATRAHVSGNTEFWEAGTLYYHPDGTLKSIWRKVKSDGTWTVDENGRVCLVTRSWEQCHYYLSYEGEVLTVSDGLIRGAYKIEAGNKLPR